MAATAGKTFNTTQHGHGDFGSRAAPRGDLVQGDSEVPGPGAYNSKLPEAPEARQGSAFASTTKRNFVDKSDTPAPGEYSLPEKEVVGGTAVFKSADVRGKTSYATATERYGMRFVGPGKSYPLLPACETTCYVVSKVRWTR